VNEDWPSSHDVARQMADEAARTAKQLGHVMTGWVVKDTTWYARCLSCDDMAHVRGGRLGHAISGAATFLHCRPKRQVPSGLR
jgi:hypothetical protein